MAAALLNDRRICKDANSILNGKPVRAALCIRSICLCCALLTVVTAVPLHAVTADAAKDRAKWRMATLAAARQVLDDFDRIPRLDDQERVLMVEALCDAMRKDVAAHAKRGDSRRRCADLAQCLRLGAMTLRIDQAAARVGEQSPLPVHPADIREALGTAWTNKADQAIAVFLNADFPSCFDSARKRAVGLASQEADQRLRFPTGAELAAWLTERLKGRSEDARLTADDGKALKEWLGSFAAPDGAPVFEELIPHLHAAAQKLFDEIRRQYDHQAAILDDTAANGVSAAARRADTIAKILNTSLESSVTQERKIAIARTATGLAVPVYDVFPVIRMNSVAAANKLEQTRLQQYLATAPALALDPDIMLKAIRANPASHITASGSEHFFVTNFAGACRPATAKAYALGTAPADDPAYFENLLLADPAIAMAYTNRITDEVRRQLPAARRAMAGEQFQAYYFTLTNNIPLADKALACLQDTGGAVVSSLPEATTLLRTGGYKDLPEPNRVNLLEETSRQVLNLANQRFKAGYQALNDQRALLQKIEQERLDQLKQDVERRRPVKEILREWQADLEQQWKSSVANHPTVYADLVANTRKQLDKTVRQLYDTIKDPPAAPVQVTSRNTQDPTQSKHDNTTEVRHDPAQPEDQYARKEKSNQAGQSDKPRPDAKEQDTVPAKILSANKIDRKNQPDGVLVMAEAPGGLCRAQLILDAPDKAALTVSFAAKDPQTSAEAIFEAFGPHLAAMFAAAAAQWQDEHSGFGFFKRKKPPKIKLFVVIESNEIRHRMSILLRKKIEEAMRIWSSKQSSGVPAMELNWKVGLSFDPAMREENP